MKLQRLTRRIWVYPFEQQRDRPNLGYVRGDRWSLAVDAGHSRAHVGEFYRALEAEGLPLPALTVLTHWHWDHTFGMHATHGLCLAGARTNAHLADFRARLAREGRQAFLGLDESVCREYAGGEPVVVTMADLTYSGEMWLDAGGCPVRLFGAVSPHTDDSTLVYAAGEKVLFLGDCACGAFPGWEKDPALSRALHDAVSGIDAEIFLTGHWTPMSRQEGLEDILSED